jgi:putative hydrolase of the HAD superfamily
VGEIYAGVARKFGSTAQPREIQEAFRQHFPHSGPLHTSDEKQWWKNVVHNVFADVGMVQDFDQFFDEIYDLFRDSRGWMLFPETVHVLEVCRRQGLKLGLISNFDSRVYSVLKDLRIDHFFSSITICSETGYAKPQPEIFHAAIASLQNDTRSRPFRRRTALLTTIQRDKTSVLKPFWSTGPVATQRCSR